MIASQQVTCVSICERPEILSSSAKYRSCLTDRNKIDPPAAVVAITKLGSRTFSDHLYAFKLDHDHPLLLYGHKKGTAFVLESASTARKVGHERVCQKPLQQSLRNSEVFLKTL